MTTTAMTTQKTHTVTTTDVRDVAAAISQEIIAHYEFYKRRCPYTIGKLRNDIGLLLLYGMSERIAFELYELVNGEKIERLSYSYCPVGDPDAGDSPPSEFPRFDFDPAWQVRVVSYYTTTKPEAEVREFHNLLGWYPIDLLTRTGQGRIEYYGAYDSRGCKVTREVYHEGADNHHMNGKELVPHENR
jgi:hypothetical protein